MNQFPADTARENELSYDQVGTVNDEVKSLWYLYQIISGKIIQYSVIVYERWNIMPTLSVG